MGGGRERGAFDGRGESRALGEMVFPSFSLNDGRWEVGGREEPLMGGERIR